MPDLPASQSPTPRFAWLGAALVAAMIVSGYVFFGYAILRALVYLLSQAGKAGW